MSTFIKDKQYYKFCAYGFLKNLRFYDVFLLLFFVENGISYSQIGILYAVREIIINVFEIPSGIVADTFGRKNALVSALISYVLSFVVFYFSTDFTTLMVAMILYGIGDAFRSGTHKGMIMDYLKINGWDDYKIDYYGHTRSWSQRGSAVSALFAGFLVLYSGSYRLIYLFTITPYLLNLFNILSYPNSLNFSINGKKKETQRSLVTVFKNFLNGMKDPQVFQIINSAAIHSSYLKAIKDYIQPVMVQVALIIPIMTTMDLKRRSGIVIGILYFVIFLMTSGASRFASKLDRLRISNIPKLTLLIGVFSGMSCGIFYKNEWWVFCLIAFVFIYLVENIRKPILTGYLADHVPNEILTSVISAQSFYSTIVTSVIAIAIGICADHFGLGTSLLSVSGVLLIFILLIGVRKPSHQR